MPFLHGVELNYILALSKMIFCTRKSIHQNNILSKPSICISSIVERRTRHKKIVEEPVSPVYEVPQPNGIATIDANLK